VCLIALVATGRLVRPGRQVVRIGLVATDGSCYLQPGTFPRAICCCPPPARAASTCSDGSPVGLRVPAHRSWLQQPRKSCNYREPAHRGLPTLRSRLPRALGRPEIGGQPLPPLIPRTRTTKQRHPPVGRLAIDGSALLSGYTCQAPADPEDTMTARRVRLDGLARDADTFEPVSGLAPLYPRNNTFPGEVFLHLAGDALNWCTAACAVGDGQYLVTDKCAAYQPSARSSSASPRVRPPYPCTRPSSAPAIFRTLGCGRGVSKHARSESTYRPNPYASYGPAPRNCCHT
jgi:hypothetical protein